MPDETTAASGPYQLLPPLTAEEYAALRSDIAARGVLVPVEYDDQGAILDGHNRVAIAAELGITDVPRVVRTFADETAKREHVLRLNLARRHLTPARWGAAFAQLVALRGVRLGQGQRNDKTSATVAEVARQLGVPTRTARDRVRQWEAYQLLPEPLRAQVDAGRLPVRRAAAEVRREASRAELAQRAAALPARLPGLRFTPDLPETHWTVPRRVLERELDTAQLLLTILTGRHHHQELFEPLPTHHGFRHPLPDDLAACPAAYGAATRLRAAITEAAALCQGAWATSARVIEAAVAHAAGQCEAAPRAPIVPGTTPEARAEALRENTARKRDAELCITVGCKEDSEGNGYCATHLQADG